LIGLISLCCPSDNTQLNVALEWLATLLLIPAFPGLNLGQETGYPDFFMIFLPPGKFRDKIFDYATTASFHIHAKPLLTDNPIALRYAMLSVESTVK
jgi:hypothetical protein